MPELPEAETIAADLRGRITGSTLTGAVVPHPDILVPGLDPQSLDAGVGRKLVEGVGRRGKNVVLELDAGTRVMVNLGMTGRLVVDDSPRAAELKHIAARFRLDDGRNLLFDDTRRFGRIELLDRKGWRRRNRELGAEPLARSFTARTLHRLTSASRTPIRNWLLDQRRIAGVGNIYACEALFRARVHPARPANDLAFVEAARLHRALRAVLREAIHERGTTFSDYRDGTGAEGRFEARLRAYGRAGERCFRCRRGTVERIVMSNRSAFLCPACQR